MIPKPLSGITVVDLSRLIPGPFCSLILAELGATVIKIEEGILKPEEKLVSRVFNHNKKKVVLDFKSREGLERFFQLVKKADVVLESFRPGVINKLGLGFGKLKKINPSVILASITGYGQKGINKNRAGHDLNYMSQAGLVSSEQVPQFQWADLVGGGLWGALAIVSAIMDKKRNKKAIHLDISMTDSMIYMGIAQWVLPQMGVSLDVITGKLARYRLYVTKDERLIALGALESKFWNAFCKAIQKPEWEDGHHRYADASIKIHQEMELLFKSKTFQEWTEWNQDKDFCLTPVLNCDEVRLNKPFKGKRLPPFPIRGNRS